MRDGRLPEKADAVIRREHMLSSGDAVVIGVSGGPDSMARFIISPPAGRN